MKEGSGALGAKHEKARLVSNKTHYSPTDPDARIFVKPGKARRLNYHCSMAVDTAQGVISHVQADFADGRDSQYLPQLVMQLQDRLKASQLLLQDLLADAAYANGSNYAFLEQRGITGWIPVFGMYKPEVAGFPYDKENDQYTCPMGKPLPFKGFDHTAEGRLIKNYWAAPKDCRACALKATCAPNTRCRKITRTAYDPEYLRAYGRQLSRKGKLNEATSTKHGGASLWQLDSLLWHEKNRGSRQSRCLQGNAIGRYCFQFEEISKV